MIRKNIYIIIFIAFLNLLRFSSGFRGLSNIRQLPSKLVVTKDSISPPQSSSPTSESPSRSHQIVERNSAPIKPISVAFQKLKNLAVIVQANLPPQISDTIAKVNTYLNNKNLKEKFTKEELSKLGLYALLSYGFVSNFSYITCVIIAWCIHGKTTGASQFITL